MTINYAEQIKAFPIYQQALNEGITIELINVEEDPITKSITEVVHEYIKDGECLCRNTTFIHDGTGDKGLEEILIMGLDTARKVGEFDFDTLQTALQADVDTEED